MIDVVETRDALDRAIADDHEADRLRSRLVGLRAEADTARLELDEIGRASCRERV